MQYEFLVLIPPIVVVVLAGITKNVRVSVGMAILISGLIASDFSPSGAFQIIATRFLGVAELSNFFSWDAFNQSFNLFVCLFLLCLGIIIELIQQSGGAYAYGNFVIDRLKSAKNAQRASLLLSLVFAIDDYFSNLTVGAVMRPVTDQFRIPRIKLALLVNALAAPLAVLFPLSSWIAEIVGQLRQAGVSATNLEHIVIVHDPFYLYLSAIPFLFYSFIVIASIWFIVNYGLSYGIVAKHESIAKKTGNLFAGRVSVARQSQEEAGRHPNASILDFLLPIFVLIMSVLLLIWQGGTVCANAIPAALFKGSLITTVFTAVFLLFRRSIAIKDIWPTVKQGVLLMAPALFVVILIWTLSALLKSDLHAGVYLANLIGGYISLVLLPALFFIVAVIISFLIGSAWGTIGTLMPMAIPMFVSLSGITAATPSGDIALLLPLIGAIISGSVAGGNHLSPISDNTFMAATSVRCYHLDLVKAMANFAIPVIVATFCSFVCAGFLIVAGKGIAMTVTLSFFVGCLINFLIIGTLHWLNLRKSRLHQQ